MRHCLTVAVAALLVAPGLAAAQCQGDANNNGFVNFADYGAVASRFGQSCDSATRFTDNGDGTITDGWTGLMWEKKVKLDTAADPNNPHDADNTYSWAGTCSQNPTSLCQPTAASSVACGAGVEGNATGCAECESGDGGCSVTNPAGTIWQWLVGLNQASFTGNNDWRVPTKDELEELVDESSFGPSIHSPFHGGACGPECGDNALPECACTSSSGTTLYGSATSFSIYPNNAWYLNFRPGYVGYDNKFHSYHVRAVRNANVAPAPTPAL